MAIQRYIETQRPYTSYLPDTMDFVVKNNAFTQQIPRRVPEFGIDGSRCRFLLCVVHRVANRPEEADELFKDEPESSVHTRTAVFAERLLHDSV